MNISEQFSVDGMWHGNSKFQVTSPHVGPGNSPEANMSARKENHPTRREEIENRVRELTWTLVDEYATPADHAELQDYLSGHEEARCAYIEAVQLHCDLQHFFSGDSASKGTPPAALSFLGGTNAAIPPMGEVGS